MNYTIDYMYKEHLEKQIETLKSFYKDKGELDISLGDLIDLIKEQQVYNISPIISDFKEIWKSQNCKTISDLDFITLNKYYGGIPRRTEDRELTVLNKEYTIPYNSVYVCCENTSNNYTSVTFIRYSETKGISFYFEAVGNDYIMYSFAFEIVDGNLALYIDELKEKRLELSISEEQMNSTIDTICSTCTFILQLFDRLTNENEHDCKCFIEQPTSSKLIYCKTSKDKPAKKIEQFKPVMIVLDKKTDEKNVRKYATRKNSIIKYSCSWIVRGHYRSLHNQNTLGVDRFGRRAILGKTWIAPYQKGNKDLPIKKSEKILIQT